MANTTKVGLWSSPFVSGTIARKYLGHIKTYRSGPHLGVLLNACVLAFQKKATRMGATDVTSVELTIDPWPKNGARWRVEMGGTPTVLKDLV
jgi:hypothetical protein